MKVDVEPMQQPILKAVGRPLTPSQHLARVEDLAAFVRKHAPQALTRS